MTMSTKSTESQTDVMAVVSFVLSFSVRETHCMQLNTYLNYGGNCEQAFKFYEQHLGGKITMLMRHGEGPTAGNTPPVE